MQIEDIIEAIRAERLRVSDHADEEAAADDLTLQEIYASVLAGEIIEDYPDDWPLPSCLIFGCTEVGDPVHSVWGYNRERRAAVLITVYRPDPGRWIDWRQRRRDQ